MLVQEKTTRHLTFVVGCLCLLLGMTACRDNEPITTKGTYDFVAPDHFPAATYTFYNNPVSEKGFKLGKRLFFDPILSIDSTISCASCHNQSFAFADLPSRPVSIGIDGLVGTRNAPGLANLAFMNEFFVDGGVNHLDFVPMNAIESPFEMGEGIANVIAKLKGHANYPRWFQEAFNTTEINTALLMDALAQFMLLMVSDNSKYDQYLRGEERLTAKELEGLKLFEQKCQSCHTGSLFTDQLYHNNGIDSVFLDSGRARISANPLDIGKFKVPSLRNVAVTPPYMHNAKFATLEEVLEHYSTRVLPSATVDPLLQQQNGDLGIPLTEKEKEAVLLFLQTLTDYEFLNNPIFFEEE
ncbi:cytochrome-c peroxidase [Aureispira anguillae]|uniref:Cytochrome-c peroxidase n=1 Tax=Aureispira anguillae TaxID=2864201 RepID=A0A915YLG1_9BACT|nr:cytochrome c peroxidase [Aureispira anguillae]BDS15097.1 cytochrome-c peroxidase [Aureispira anguillae]